MIRRDPLFKGCTRPAMLFGVPLVPLAVVVGTVILLAVWTTVLMVTALVPIVLVMKAIAKSDDQQFRLLFLKLWCRFAPHRNSNRRFWKSSAYAPIAFKKR